MGLYVSIFTVKDVAVSIQLIAPASGATGRRRIPKTKNLDRVSIQLIAPASGALNGEDVNL